MAKKVTANDLVTKRNKIARHVGNAAKTANEMGLDAKTRDLPTTVIDRDVLLQDLLKLIHSCPMEDAFKEVLRIRITYPDQAPALFMRLGFKHGISLKTIMQMEEYAKEKIMEFLKKNSLQDAIGQFNAASNQDAVDIKNKMASEKSTIITDDFTAK